MQNSSNHDIVARITAELKIETEKYLEAVALNQTHLFGIIRSNITLLQDELEKARHRQMGEGR
jgi:hypothetical protein